MGTDRRFATREKVHGWTRVRHQNLSFFICTVDLVWVESITRHLDATSLTFNRVTPTAPAELDKSPRNCDGIMVTGPLTTSLDAGIFSSLRLIDGSDRSIKR